MSSGYQVVWSEAAIRDVENIIDYIAAQGNPGNAEKVHDKLMASANKLALNPRRCRIVPELKFIGVGEYRELIVSPYRICFRIHERDIALVAILDGRRQLDELLVARALGL